MGRGRGDGVRKKRERILGLKSFLKEYQGSIIALDTMLFIYLFEEDEKYIDDIQSLFESIEKGNVKAVTSAVTIIECLTKPLKKNDFPLVARYKTAFRNFPNLTVLPVSLEMAEKAASIRAAYGLKTPDSIQVAGGILGRAKTFLTNDFHFEEIEGIRVMQLSTLL